MTASGSHTSGLSLESPVRRCPLPLAVLSGILIWGLSQDGVFGQNPVSVDIRGVESMFVHSFGNTDRALRIGLQVRVTNRSTSDLLLRRTQFRLACDDGFATASSMNSPEALKQTALAPGRSVEGRVWFTARRFPRTPGAIQLLWQSDADEVATSVDEFVSRESQFLTTRIGPGNSLLLVSTKRQLDALSVHHLRQILQQVATPRPRRLVLAVREDAASREISDEVYRWFYQSLSTTQSESLTPLPFPESPLQFLAVHLAGFSNSRRRTVGNPGNTIRMLRTEEEAVAAALGNMYRHVPVADLLKDLKADHPGVRRAVTQHAIDRLTVSQIRRVLTEVADSEERTATVKAIAAGLHKVADPAVFPLISELARDASPEVAAAGIRSLTLHPGAAALSATLEIWEERPDLHRQIIEGAIESQDDRWGRLISDHAISLLKQSVGHSGAEAAEIAPVPPEAIIDRSQVPPPPPDYPESIPDDQFHDHLRKVLACSSPDRLPAVLAAACDALDAIRSPTVQVVVVMFIVEHDQGQYSPMIRQFLTARIQQDALTDSLGNLIYLYPDPRWTEPLLEISRNPQISASRSQQMVQRALRCSTTSQLDIFAREFDRFPTPSQALILQQLSGAQHPRWRELADFALAQRPPLFNTALDVLHTDGSEESITILHRQLIHYLKQVDADTDRSGTVQSCNRLISKISLFSHPGSRKLLNHCTHSTVPEIRQQATNARNAAARRSPGHRAHLKVRELMTAGQWTAALTQCQQAVAADPLFAEAWLTRAQLLMRLDRPQEALQDYQLAAGLSPDDTRILSGMAIACIQTAQTETGIEIAEASLKLGATDAELHYETACLYGQISQMSGVSEQQQSDARERALSLLKEAVALGFWDAPRALMDARLASLRVHADWPDTEAMLLRAEKQKPIP